MWIETLGSKLPRAPRPGEESPFVFMFIELDHICPWKRSFGEDHG
jgi:hypothetical protein